MASGPLRSIGVVALMIGAVVGAACGGTTATNGTPPADPADPAESDVETAADRACQTSTDCALSTPCYCNDKAVNTTRRAELDARNQTCPPPSPNAGPCPTFVPYCASDRSCKTCYGDGCVQVLDAGGPDARD